MAPMVEIKDLTKNYERDSQNIPVLEKISLLGEEGEF